MNVQPPIDDPSRPGATQAGRPISMVEYYEAQDFNPVLIRVEDPEVWRDHQAKRRNLYERHLGIPLPLLRDRRVLEFGCNSGENALVLAGHGARLTFVEPHAQVAPRLQQLFRAFGQGAAIQAFHHADLGSFQTAERFDLVIAEGFLSTLPDRNAMLGKLISLVQPGGFGVISYNDRLGGLLEMLKRAVLFRAYALEGIADIQSGRALDIARDCFEADFLELKASRSFEAWWRDTMVAPVYTEAELWSLPEILTLLEAGGAEVQGTSPAWSDWEHYRWYKDVPDPQSASMRLREDWQRNLVYFLTGLRPATLERIPSQAVLEEAAGLVGALSRLGTSLSPAAPPPVQAEGLLAHLASDPSRAVQEFAAELGSLLEALGSAGTPALLARYRDSHRLRALWGTAYHYLCFRVPPA